MNTESIPTGSPTAGPDTGAAAAEGSTPPSAETATPDPLHRLRLTLQAMRATQREQMTRAASCRAWAEVYRHDADGADGPDDARMKLYAGALFEASQAERLAGHTKSRIALLLEDHPELHTVDAEAAARAEVLIVITDERIQIQTTLHMAHRMQRFRDERCWTRKGLCSWAAHGDDFTSRHESSGIGIELAEFCDAIDLPTRVADMLPREPADTAARAAEAKALAES